MGPGFLVIDTEGAPIDMTPDPTWGEAVLLVLPVTDALQRVADGRLVGAVDRDRMVAVSGFALADRVVNLLGAIPRDPRALYGAVVDLGVTWDLSFSGP